MIDTSLYTEQSYSSIPVAGTANSTAYSPAGTALDIMGDIMFNFLLMSRYSKTGAADILILDSPVIQNLLNYYNNRSQLDPAMSDLITTWHDQYYANNQPMNESTYSFQGQPIINLIQTYSKSLTVSDMTDPQLALSISILMAVGEDDSTVGGASGIDGFDNYTDPHNPLHGGTATYIPQAIIVGLYQLCGGDPTIFSGILNTMQDVLNPANLPNALTTGATNYEQFIWKNFETDYEQVKMAGNTIPSDWDVNTITGAFFSLFEGYMNS